MKTPLFNNRCCMYMYMYMYVAYININIKASIAQILFQAKTNTTEEKENCQLRFVLHADWRLHLEIKDDGLSAK